MEINPTENGAQVEETKVPQAPQAIDAYEPSLFKDGLLVCAYTLFVLAVLVYTAHFLNLLNVRNILKTFNTPDKVWEVPPTPVSTIQGISTTLKNMDTQLEASDVSKDDKIHLLLNRGFLATVVRSSDERVEDSVTTINSYFNQVMELTKDEKEKYIHARQKAVFGLLYSFVNHSFSGLILPEKYRVQFFKEKMTEKEIQQAYFRSIIFYYNDTSTTSKITDFLSEDKVFLGTRMVTLAAYLSSFKDQMPKEEVATLQQSLTRDLDAYTTSHKVIFDEAIRSELIPSGQRAFAFDTLITSSTTKLSSQQNEQIDATYNNARHDLGVSLSDDPISLSIIGMMNDSYQLASMKRRFGEKVTKQKDYPNVVASLINNILHSDETKNAASFLYRVGLFSSSETWFIPGKYFSQAVKENKQLQGLLTSLGASLQ